MTQTQTSGRGTTGDGGAGIGSVSRRVAIATVGGGAIAIGLAACAPAASGGTGGISNGGGPAGGSSVIPTKNAAGVESLPLSDVPVGGSIITSVGGQPIAVAQLTAGKVTAFSAVCTHQGCIIASSGTIYQCPCHGSQFNPTTGAVLRGPANQPLPAVTATLNGDQIEFPS